MPSPGSSFPRSALLRSALACALLAAGACTNDPYPRADATRKVLYRSFSEAPRTLDPAVAYTTSAHEITGNVYESLLEYDYVARPYELIPSLAQQVPEPSELDDGRVRYRFDLRRGVEYADDPCFTAFGSRRPTREVVAADFAFELARVADPAIASPVIQNLSKIQGMMEFGAALAERRTADARFGALPVHEQYAEVGGVEGVRVLDRHTLELVLAEPYPQILYWLAMPFTSPVPWEAVAYYDGEAGREHFRDHPVGTGPYRLTEYAKQARMVLEENPRWRARPEPGPGQFMPDLDEALPDAVQTTPPGTPLPLIERIDYRREREAIPAFGKFLQGYYDASGIIKESFDKVVREDQLSPEMAERGMRLEKTVEPAVYYLGFNMDDPVVGGPAGERGRKLRQAMSLVVDVREYARLFLNDRGVPAQTPIPPGIFGYDPDYRNPYREVDAERARSLLEEAGYPGGIDPDTGRPLRLTYDTPDTTSAALLASQFFIDAWRSIGLDVEIQATTYNQFQEKMRKGAYQIFRWGWVADYPDPENFLFLLESSNGRTQSGGPNSANYANPEYDALFEQMKTRPNDARRQELIEQMRAILERDRPWIELYHPEAYSLFHPWLRNVNPFGMSYPMVKYYAIDAEQRAELRDEWNDPIVWPAYALAALALLITIPGVITFYRERV